MTQSEKLELATSLLDELATVGYLENVRYKLEALRLVRLHLDPFTLPAKSTKADKTLEGAKLLANINTPNLNKQLNGLALLAEKALSELHLQSAKTIING